MHRRSVRHPRGQSFPQANSMPRYTLGTVLELTKTASFYTHTPITHTHTSAHTYTPYPGTPTPDLNPQMLQVAWWLKQLSRNPHPKGSTQTRSLHRTGAASLPSP